MPPLSSLVTRLGIEKVALRRGRTVKDGQDLASAPSSAEIAANFDPCTSHVKVLRLQEFLVNSSFYNWVEAALLLYCYALGSRRPLKSAL